MMLLSALVPKAPHQWTMEGDIGPVACREASLSAQGPLPTKLVQPASRALEAISPYPKLLSLGCPFSHLAPLDLGMPQRLWATLVGPRFNSPYVPSMLNLKLAKLQDLPDSP